MRQCPNPSRVNLPFRYEQTALNPLQGNPVGFVPQVQRPNRQTQVQKNLKRADLEFRTENYAYSPRGDDSSATMRLNGGSVNIATCPAYNSTVESSSVISKPSECHVTSVAGPVAPHIKKKLLILPGRLNHMSGGLLSAQILQTHWVIPIPLSPHWIQTRLI